MTSTQQPQVESTAILLSLYKLFYAILPYNYLTVEYILFKRSYIVSILDSRQTHIAFVYL
jgi:hypothetical protein